MLAYRPHVRTLPGPVPQLEPAREGLISFAIVALGFLAIVAASYITDSMQRQAAMKAYLERTRAQRKAFAEVLELRQEIAAFEANNPAPKRVQ